MNVLISLAAVIVLLLLAWVGTAGAGLNFVFGALIPWVAIALFIGGIIVKVARWARAPVPFRIPTTAGQQKSLPWIRHSKLDNPFTKAQVWGRMALEVLFFRSLFRNTRTEVRAEGPQVTYGSSEWLWLFAILFHWGMLVVLLRHLRFFLDPVPGAVSFLEGLDGFLQVGSPPIFITTLLMLFGLSFLLLRRLTSPQLRYISLTTDYFPLFLLLGIVISGLFIRHDVRADIIGVKTLALGIVTFKGVTPDLHWLVYGHILLVSTLIAYFPFSKLMHMLGVFLSPTRNLANNNRAVRHINPWNYPVKLHTYAEYEDEFREKMVKAGVPVEKEE